jgi:membrane-bound lytic murein transglycosylase B|tara:strand:- start:662 stop:1477 length:816 start_codon:yes stop_codon:yes gene_type:complete
MKIKFSFFYTILLLVSSVFGHKAKYLKNDSVYKSVLPLTSKKNIPLDFVKQSFKSESVKIYEDIPDRFEFAYEKKEYPEYKKIFLTEKRINEGVEFYLQNSELIESISDSLQVDPFLILSITGIESNFGSHPGHYDVFSALYTIVHSMPERKNWASKELAEFLEYCYNDKIPVHSITGSYAGAFGFGQFIPSSFNRFAVDFDKDGIRRFDEWADVMASIANYLLKNGYEPGGSFERDSKNWDSVYAYNHHNNYVMAVLDLRLEYKNRITGR